MSKYGTKRCEEYCKNCCDYYCRKLKITMEMVKNSKSTIVYKSICILNLSNLDIDTSNHDIILDTKDLCFGNWYIPEDCPFAEDHKEIEQEDSNA